MNIKASIKETASLIALRFGTRKEREMIIENMSNLVASGVSVRDALASIKEELSTKKLKEALEQVRVSIENGSPAWRALERSRLFSDSIITLVRIGEETERLSENLSVIAEHSKKNRTFKSKLFSAMMYPVLVLTVTLVVGIAIAWFILPRLAVVFSEMNADLPLLTEIIIQLGLLLQNHGALVVPSFMLGLILIIMTLFVFPRTKHIGQNMILHLPGFRTLVTQVEISRFTYLLGTLLDAGLPVHQALASLRDVTTVKQYRSLYQHLLEEMKHGYTFKHAFSTYKKSNKLIPVSVRQMITTGEQSGNLPQMLIHISSLYEEKSEASTKNIGVLLEPILLVIVWLAVLVVALGVITPIYGLLSNIR